MAKIFKNKTDLISNLIKDDEFVLDVGFWGQGVSYNDQNWVHKLIRNKTNNLYGIDLDFDENLFSNNRENYFKMNAESFDINKKSFDVIFAGDLIKHLSNPGLFLKNSYNHLKDTGRLILTTPNAFNLFNLAGKITNIEPVVNHDHTCYFNSKTITKLLQKNGWKVDQIAYLYTLDVKYKESIKKRFLNVIYKILSYFTPKYVETMVVVAKKKV